jgi:quinohemoprotein ethanol dehydrogenase
MRALLRTLRLGLACIAAATLLGAAPGKKEVDWIGVGGATGEPHYGDLDQIQRGNVQGLGLAWSLDLPDEHALEATPLAVGGTLYFSGQAATIYAVDGRTGRLLWTYDPESWRYRPRHQRLMFPANRGVAYAEGKVIVGTLDGRLIAVDAKTGKPVWTVKTVADDSYQTVTGAPRIAGRNVVIGSAGGDLGARGYVSAYDVATGTQKWRFYTAPGNPAHGFEQPAMAIAAKTWSGEWWKTGTGGTVWEGMVYDPALNRIYVGTGNAGPYNPRLRNPGGGDNLFLASIVALDANTGRYIWHYQVNPNEAWDYKATANLILADVTVAGRPRHVIMQAPTNGFFYVLDRVTGELLSAEKIEKVTWAERIDMKTGRPVETSGIRYDKAPFRMWPGPLGAHNWQAMSYSPRTGLVYIPVMHKSAEYTGIPGLVAHPMERTPEMPWVDAVSVAFDSADAEDGTGGLLAWDPATQTAKWRISYPHMWNGGTMATAGDLLFQGDGEGIFHAYDAINGGELWRFDAKLGIVGAPITYSIGGRQYVSILVGFGGATNATADVVSRGWKYNAQPRRLLTFVLGGKAKLPPTAPRDMTVKVAEDGKVRLDQAAIARGAVAFMSHCILCHGFGARSPGTPGPDLRESAAAMDEAALTALLQQGGLEPRGMPKFDEFTPANVRDLQMYIRAMARDARGAAKPTRTADVPTGGL